MLRILLLEDEVGLGKAIREHVASEGHAVDWFTTLADARASLETVDYDLILLDLMLPDGRGIDLLKELRGQSNHVAVIILTALDQISDRINGLTAGADDYLVKPFDLGELSARILALHRRLMPKGMAPLCFDDLEIDIAHKVVTKAGELISLSSREWAVLERLLRQKNALISKSKIEDTLYEFGAEVESNTVEVYVSRLRKKIGKDFIETVRGIGYRVKVPSHEA